MIGNPVDIARALQLVEELPMDAPYARGIHISADKLRRGEPGAADPRIIIKVAQRAFARYRRGERDLVVAKQTGTNTARRGVNRPR